MWRQQHHPIRGDDRFRRNVLLFLGLPFLFGFGLAFLYFLRHVIRFTLAGDRLDAITCLFCVSLLIWASVLTGYVGAEGDFKDRASAYRWLGFAGSVWLGTIAALVVSVVRRLGPVRRPICVLCCAAPALYYFLLWVEEARHGLWVSVAACVVIGIGATWEAVRTA